MSEFFAHIGSRDIADVVGNVALVLIVVTMAAGNLIPESWRIKISERIRKALGMQPPTFPPSAMPRGNSAQPRR